MTDRSSLVVTLYSRRDCGLCDEAEAALQRLAPSLGLRVQVVDVDADSALTVRYGDAVPVVAVGETIVARAPIDEPALIAALAAL